MSTIHNLSTSIAPPVVFPAVRGEPSVRRFSVDEYHRMIENGILTENDRVELLDGWILEMSPIGPPHGVCVDLLLQLLQSKLPAGWFLRLQSSVTLSQSEPEPDVSVIRGNPRDFVKRHPMPADVGLLIEVADSTIRYDQRQKLPVYAAAGIPEYWIVNLIDRTLEVHRDPAGADYRHNEVIAADGQVEFSLDGQAVARLAVADFLP
jgi:Uma2 family endonuclease